jgi:MFS family permease
LRLATRPRILASFEAPGFRLFYIHSTFAAVDMSVRMAVHGWLVLELSNDSEFWTGIYALCLGTGQFLSSMLAGAIVDRFQRRNVLLVEGTLSATIACGLAAATFLEAATLHTVIGLAFVIGCLRGVRFTAANRLIYDLVGPRQLVNGMSLWRISATPMMIMGSLLAGGLIQWFGIWLAYGFLGVSLVVSLPFLAMIGVRGAVDRSDTNLLEQTVEGVRYAAKDRALRTLFTMSIVMETLGFAFLLMIPVMAKTVLEVGGIGLGFLQAGVGAGMFVATLVMAARGDSENKPRIILLNALLAGAALIGFALSRSLLLSILFATAVMAFLNAYDLTLGALMQLAAPTHFRGRAASMHSLAISFTAVGGFIMGAAGGVVGVPVVLAAGGAGIIINSLLRRPALMLIRERPHEPQIESERANPTQNRSTAAR